MDVETAKAQLKTVEAAEKYRAAKAAFQADVADGADPQKSKKRPAFIKARAAHVEATNNWRNNYRTAPDGEGDSTASPDPLTVRLDVS